MSARWAASFASRERVFEALTADAHRLAVRGKDAEAAHAVSIAAEYAWRCPFGLLVSPDLERLLERLSLRLNASDATAARPPIGGVLQVATRAVGTGGHSRILRQWVEADTTRTHDLALTEQGGREVPPDITRAITASGGAVHDLDGLRIGERVRALRDLADGRGFCVLHQDPSDVVPSLALLAEPRSCATILVNHADHAFWLGTSVADVVAHLRPSAITASSRHRGLSEDAATIIPLPFAPSAAKADRATARATLGIEPHDVLLLSVASEYKYGDGASAHFLDALEPLLARYVQLRVLVVGPRESARWRAAAGRFGGRVQAVGPQLDIAPHLAAADIYVDSYPFPSFTSALQAAQYGLPTVGRRASHPALAYLQLDDEAGGAAITWVADDAALGAVIATWLDDAPARQRAGAAAADEIERLSRDDEWRRSIERTYARASALAGAARGRTSAPTKLPEQLAEALADAHHWGRVDGAFFHTLLRDRDGIRTPARATRTLRTLWRTRVDHRSQRALAAFWRDRVTARSARP